MARGKRTLDMLPLLDVFMVILFVFATIQEGKLDVTTQAARETSEQLEVAEATVAQLQSTIEQAQIEERLAELQTTKDALQEKSLEAEQLDKDLATAKTENQNLEQQTQELQGRLEDTQKAAQELKDTTFASDDQYRQQDVLEKLLDQNSVFEVEVRGEFTIGGIVNHCCFRADPRSDDWQSCGEIPPVTERREDWFRGGANGLLRTLQQTKGGNAMTIIRQDSKATYRVGTKLEELIRLQVPDQKVYNEGIAMIEVHCQP